MVSSINSKSVYLELQFEENSIRLETYIEKILCPGFYFWTFLQNGTMISIYSVCASIRKERLHAFIDL